MESNPTHSHIYAIVKGLWDFPFPAPQGSATPDLPPFLNLQTRLCPWQVPESLVSHTPARRGSVSGPPAAKGGPAPAGSAPSERGGQRQLMGGSPAAGAWTFLKDQSCPDSS